MYTNLFTLGYNLGGYLLFVASKIECLVGLVGIVLVGCTFKERK